MIAYFCLMKNKKDWQLLKQEPAIDLGILNVKHHYYKNPRNEKVIKTVAIEAQNAVNVIALTKDNKVIMVKQFRFGIGDYTLEIPGGMIDAGEATVAAAKRELKEETGYIGNNWKSIGKILSNPVFMNSYVYHYITYDATKEFELDLDEAEQVELVELSIPTVFQYIQEGIILHPHTITAFYFAAKELLEK